MNQMEYIANIITNNKIEVSTFFNVTDDFNSIDRTIPTLIIGWNETKKLFIEQDILVNKICDNIYWTFSKREKRYKYEKDLKNFIEYVISIINEKANYKFFNYILSSENKKNNFINYVNKGGCSIYYNSRFMYVYSSSDSITLGISLNDLSYIGININNFLLSLNRNNNNLITNDLKFIDNESLTIIKDNAKIIAYLNYLKNKDIYK